MIYFINGKYYVNISPSIYSEIEAKLKGDEVILKPKGAKIEVNNATTISVVSINDIKKALENKNNEDVKPSKKKNKFYE